MDEAKRGASYTVEHSCEGGSFVVHFADGEPRPYRRVVRADGSAYHVVAATRGKGG